MMKIDLKSTETNLAHAGLLFNPPSYIPFLIKNKPARHSLMEENKRKPLPLKYRSTSYV